MNENFYLDDHDMICISKLLKQLHNNSLALEYSRKFEVISAAMCSDDCIIYNSRDDTVDFSHGY